MPSSPDRGPDGGAAALAPAAGGSQGVPAPAEAVYPRFRWVIVALLSTPFPVGAFVVLSFGILLPYYRDEFSITNSQAGLMSSAGWVAPIFLSIPAALLVVRLPPKWVFAGVLAAITVLLVAHSLAEAFAVLFVARLLYSAIPSVTFPTIALMRTQWVAKREMGRMIGVQMGASNIGQSLALLGVPILIRLLDGWRPVFLVYAAGTLVVLALWLVLGKERKAQEYAEDEAPNRAGGLTPLQIVADAARPVGAAFRHREFVLSGVGTLGNVIPFMAMATFLPSFLIEQRGLTREQAGMLMALLPLGGITANLLNNILSDRIGLRRPFIWPVGIIAPAVYVGVVQPLPIGALAFLAFMIGYVAWSPVAPLMATLFSLPGIRPKEIAAAYSVTQSIEMCGFVLGPVLVGFLADGLGGDLRLALMISAFGPLTIAMSGLLVRETGRRHTRLPPGP